MSLKFLPFTALFLSLCLCAFAQPGSPDYTPRDNYAPRLALELDLKTPVKQVRAAPVNLGAGEKGFVVVFSEDPNDNPFEESFFFPKHPPLLAVFNIKGKELWRRTLDDTIPGTWFLPVLPMDMNNDGIDEIYYVANTSAKPLNPKSYKLERADARTGKVTAQIDWPAPSPNQSNSAKWRFSLIGGHAKNGSPIIISGVGTYRDMRLTAYNADLKKRWEVYYPDDPKGNFKGPRASHTNARVDLDHDGSGQFMWGERCINIDDGKERFVLDGGTWNEHSDTVLPIYERATGRWHFWTTREKGDNGKLPRAVMFDQGGKQLWAVTDLYGHFHYGWVGNFGPHGERIAMAGRYAIDTRQQQAARAAGMTNIESEEFKFYDADTGKQLPRPKFSKTGRVVDFNGDGVHEICNKGTLYDRNGNKIFEVRNADFVMSGHMLDLPGEQIMFVLPGGKIQIWADRNAVDTPEMKTRYTDSVYVESLRHSAVGYNARFPVLNY